MVLPLNRLDHFCVFERANSNIEAASDIKPVSRDIKAANRNAMP